uniref:Uncharacterized protein n=1 Tax=Podarcis muralis TaxID=64176 RepID=A0A670IWN5_PODMU
MLRYQSTSGLPFATTKTGIALLYDEISENTYEIRLKLTKEVLTIQKQDVICVSGSDHSANVSASLTLCSQPYVFSIFQNYLKAHCSKQVISKVCQRI